MNRIEPCSHCRIATRSSAALVAVTRSPECFIVYTPRKADSFPDVGVEPGFRSEHPTRSDQPGPYEPSEPTVYSQIASLQATGADVFFDPSSAKFSAQAIKHAAEVGWKPTHILNGVLASIGSVFKPAGLENSKGILSASYLKDATDPTWKDDPGLKEWSSFMDRYFPEGDKTSGFTVYGYTWAQVLVAVLLECGDDLTRANVMKQAENLKNLTFGMLLPGITVNTSPNDYAPVKQFQMARFDGQHLVLFGPLISGEMAGN
jgi:branched-chain amino acid transport system substrate-binding protein